MTSDQSTKVEDVLRQAVDHHEPPSVEIPRRVRRIVWIIGAVFGLALAAPTLLTFFGR